MADRTIPPPGGGPAPAGAADGTSSIETPFQRFVRAYRSDRLAVAALAMLAMILLAALLCPWLSPQNPYDLAVLDVMDSRLAPGERSGDGRFTFWLGSDEQGRDVLSAILYGVRTSLAVGIGSTLLALAIGVTLGLTAAYVGGRVQVLIMRVADIQLSFPPILIALILLALTGPGVGKIIIALVAVQWAYYARTARSAALVELGKEYIEAARGLRLSAMRITFRHLLPNCVPPLTIICAMQVAAAISLEATLSFLGLGLPPTEPSLGLLISNGSQYLMSGKFWISVFPGIALLVLIVCINLVADHLRDVLNPRLQVH
jgi:peptide/nickel transport system permease protein